MIQKIFTYIFVFFTITPLFSQWEQLSSLPGIARHHPICFSLEDKGYVLCGNPDTRATTEPYLGDFFSYDIENDVWEQKADFPGTPRGFGVGLNYDGKGYAGFGYGDGMYLNDLWEYDAETDTWTQLPDCPCLGRTHPAFLAAQGKIFVGLGGTGKNANDWWSYDLETRRWQQEDDFPGVVRHHPYYFTINDVPYVGFGHGNNDANGNVVVLNDFAGFDVQSGTWTKLADFPSHGRVAGTHFAVGDKGYIVAGDNEFHRYDDGEFWEYDPMTDLWKQLPTFPEDGRWAPGAFANGDYGYFIGGYSRNTRVYHGDLWRYKVRQTTNVNNQDDLPFISLTPNPTDGMVFLDISLDNLQQIDVVDQLGRKVMDLPVMASQDVSELQQGNYTVRLHYSGLIRFLPFVKI